MSDGRAQIDPEALLAHGDFVRAIARSLLWDEHAAEDVVQQTWLAALGAPAGASRGWLGAVAHNLAIKRLRGDRRRVVREAAASRPEAVPSDVQILERERLRRSVVAEVLALPEPYRATVLLGYFETLPPRDVARRMDVPVETVRTRTRRAIEMLRVRLDERHGDERGAFCGALAIWAGTPRGGAIAAGSALGGGIVMGKAVVVGSLAVVAAFAAWMLWPHDAADTTTAAAPPGAAAPAAAAPGSGGSENPAPPRQRADAEVAAAAAAAPEPSKEPVLRGRIVDKAGRGIADAMVVVSGAAVRTPGSGAPYLRSDADGLFTWKAGAAGDVTVTLRDEAMFDPTDGTQRDVEVPCDEVVFVVDRKPTATLAISGWDAETGKPLPYVACDFGARRVSTWGGTNGRLMAVVRLASAAGDVVHLVASFDGGYTGERDIGVKDGDRVDVRVDVSREGEIRGRVVDSSGAPVANAIVFLGEEDKGRGDEPFKPFEEKRIRDGVRTDRDGKFELRGAGRWVSIWHTHGGPVTVPRGDAANVVLPARGVVRGVLRAADGTPEPNRKLWLDRVYETTTDATGRFEFTNVEPGTRGLSLSGGKPKAYVAVRVGAGATVDVEVRPGLPSVRIEWPGRTSLGRFVGLVPLGEVGSLGIGQPADGAITVTDLLPGRYVLLGEVGAVAEADVTGPTATAIVGTGEIVVHASPKKRLWVVPAGAGYLARLLGGRQAGAGVPADGVQRFTGLAPGRYEVGVECDGARATVEVKDGIVETTIE